MKIAHLTSAHPRFDTRIFVKQCKSLAQAGHQVTLVVADGLGQENIAGIDILDVGKVKGRIKRIVLSGWRVAHAALAIKADLYFLHDPELLPYGYWLKKKGFKVIFDSHEDVPTQLLSKPYLKPWILKIIAGVYAGIEKFITKRLDAVLAATPVIRDKFLVLGANSVDVNNFPKLEEFPDPAPWEYKTPLVCYVGGIARIRGAIEMVKAFEHVKTPTQFLLAGNFEDEILGKEMQSLAAWNKVNYLGFQNRVGIANTLASSMVGLVTLHPTPNYIEALPVKMFEYMAAGIVVVASDFPLWKSIIEKAQCGLCVDPLNPAAIAKAIDALLSQPELAYQMGQRGRQAVLAQYNWDVEEKKLLALVQFAEAQ